MIDLLPTFATAESSSPASWFGDAMQWANVQKPWQLWWIGFGMLAQGTFFCRWLVQWLASERRGESHMPDLFWWMSLAGASTLLIYYIGRGEPVGALGQSVGWIVYSRNLYLIKKKRHAGPTTPPAGSGPGP